MEGKYAHEHKTFVFIHSLVPTPKFNPFRAHHLRTLPSAPETGSASSSASSISHVLNSTRNPLRRHHSSTLSCPFLVGPTSTWQSKIIFAPLSLCHSCRTCTWPCVLAIRAMDSAWLYGIPEASHQARDSAWPDCAARRTDFPTFNGIGFVGGAVVEAFFHHSRTWTRPSALAASRARSV